MADTAPVAAAPAASPKAKKVKSPKKAKTSAAKAPANHPTYSDMIRRAITDLKNKKGSSRASLLKYILSNFKVGGNVIQINKNIRQALKKGVSTGALKQVKGTGASGSFRIGEKAVKAKKPKVVKAKKPKAAGTKKPKSASPKKAAATKKPKAAAGTKKPKSPKKKTATKKAAGTKPKSPKKAKKPAAKKPAAKKVVKKATKAPKAAPAASINPSQDFLERESQ